MENATFLHPKEGCHLNFEEENDIVIYMVSFLGSLAVLPGNIISALFMDKIGRIRIIGEIVSSHGLSQRVPHLFLCSQAVPCWSRLPAPSCCCSVLAKGP